MGVGSKRLPTLCLLVVAVYVTMSMLRHTSTPAEGHEGQGDKGHAHARGPRGVAVKVPPTVNYGTLKAEMQVLEQRLAQSVSNLETAEQQLHVRRDKYKAVRCDTWLFQSLLATGYPVCLKKSKHVGRGIRLSVRGMCSMHTRGMCSRANRTRVVGEPRVI